MNHNDHIETCEEYLTGENREKFINEIIELDSSDKVKDLYVKMLHLDDSQRDAIENLIDTLINTK